MDQEFAALMDQICSALVEGELWHERHGNEMRKIALRGWGRWHDAEACGDMKLRLCIEKLLRDRLGYAPTINMQAPTKAVTLTVSAIADLPTHLQNWIEREKAFAQTLTLAMKMAAEIDVEIYQKLIAMLNEVQGEAMRVKLCGMRLEAADWGHHDTMVVSMLLHKHYEKNPEDQDGNTNLG